MRTTLALSVLLLATSAYGQGTPAAPRPSTQPAATAAEVDALREQVRALVAEVAKLRAEVERLAAAKKPAERAGANTPITVGMTKAQLTDAFKARGFMPEAMTRGKMVSGKTVREETWVIQEENQQPGQPKRIYLENGIVTKVE